jgi:lysophospholipase L1-like esterase
MKAIAALAFALLVASCSQLPGSPPGAEPSQAQRAAQNEWRSELAAFAEADRRQMPPPGGVLFVGSSTIRMWETLAQDFGEQPVVINRGFGGSTMADCSLLARELVVRYRPRQVLLYAGDNDLALGRTPQQVLAEFARFVAAVRAELPAVRIEVISVKPSPARQVLLPRMREANALLAAHVKTLSGSAYIDVFTPMLGPDGRPRAELFADDQLHLSAAGYRLWQSVIGPYLSPPAH